MGSKESLVLTKSDLEKKKDNALKLHEVKPNRRNKTCGFVEIKDVMVDVLLSIEDVVLNQDSTITLTKKK